MTGASERVAAASRAGMIRQLCPDCNGSGYRLYPSTATWRGGLIGGAAITRDVCDTCWGSGDAEKSWPSHARAEELERQCGKETR